MRRSTKTFQPGMPYHITHRAIDGIDLFVDDAERRYYLAMLKRKAEQYEVEILSWCLMTTHIHLLVIAPSLKALARMVAEVDGPYARHVNRRLRRKGPVYAERYHSSLVAKDEYLFAVLRYIDQNPQRAGMVGRPWEYAWSSARYHVGLVPTDVLVSTRAPQGLEIDWRELLSSEPPEIDEIREATRVNRPLGGFEASRLRAGASQAS